MFFSDDKTIEALQKQIIEQQQTISMMRETIASELMDQSKFLGPLLTGPGAQFADMFVAFFLALWFHVVVHVVHDKVEIYPKSKCTIS